MIVKHLEGSNTFIFKAGPKKKRYFEFLLSDFSAFGNKVKHPEKIRGPYRQCMKILLKNKLNELVLTLEDGEYFEVGSPVFSRGRTAADIKEFCKMYKRGEIKPELPKLEVTIKIPAGNAIRVNTSDGCRYYVVNDHKKFIDTDNIDYVEEVSGVWF